MFDGSPASRNFPYQATRAFASYFARTGSLGRPRQVGDSQGRIVRNDGVDLRSRHGGQRAERLHERKQVRHAPMLGDPAVAHSHDVDRFEVDLPTGRSHTQKRSLVGPVIRLECCHQVPVGCLPMDLGAEVGKAAPRERYRPRTPALSGSCSAVACDPRNRRRRPPRRRRSSPALHFFRVPMDDGLCGFG